VPEHRGRPPPGRRAGRGRGVPSPPSPALRAGHSPEARARPVPEYRLPDRLHVPARRQRQRDAGRGQSVPRARSGRVPAGHDDRRQRRFPVAARHGGPHRFRLQAAHAAHVARRRGDADAQPAGGLAAELVRTYRGQRLVAVVGGSHGRVAATAHAVVGVVIDVGHVAELRAAAPAPADRTGAAAAAVPTAVLGRERRDHRVVVGRRRRRDGRQAQVVRRRGGRRGPVQVRRVREDVLDRVRADQAPAVPLRGRRGAVRRGQDVPVQVLRQGVQHARRAQDAHPHAHAAVHLQAVWQGVQPAVAAAGPHPHAHRREAVLVPALQPGVRRPVQLARAPADPLGREEVLVPDVQQDVQPHVAAHQALRHRMSPPVAPTPAAATATATATDGLDPRPPRARARLIIAYNYMLNYY